MDLLELYDRLPNELQRIIKYYTLISPHKKKIKEYKYPIYIHSIRYIHPINIYMEHICISNPLKKNTIINEDRDSFYTTDGFLLKLKFMSIYNHNRFEIEKKMYIDYIKWNLSLRERNYYSQKEFNKPFSRLNKQQLFIILDYIYYCY